MKRWTALLVCGVLLLCGCAPTQTVQTPRAAQEELLQVTLGLWELDGSWENEDTAKLTQLIAERFQVELRCFDMSTLNDSPGQVVGAVLPDVFTFPVQDYAYLYQTLVDMGRVRDIPYSLYDQQPHLTKVMGSQVALSACEEKMYYVPRTFYARHADAASSMVIYYRRDWAEKLQVGPYDTQAPTWTQFYQMMQAFTYSDPDGNDAADTYGLVGYGEGFGTLWQAFLMPFGVREWVLEKGAWQPGLLSERGKTALEWFNDAYRNGYLDPNWQQYDQQAALDAFCAGRAGMLVLPATEQAATLLENEWNKLRPEEYIGVNVSVLPQPLTPQGTAYNETAGIAGGILFKRELEDEKLARVLAVLDYLLSEEGVRQSRYGTAGVDYTTVDGRICSVYTDAQGGVQPLAARSPQMSALSALMTQALDGGDAQSLGNYQAYALAMAQAFWWPNTWRREMFTDYLTDLISSTAAGQAALQEAALRYVRSTSDCNATWDSFVADTVEALQLQEVIDAVNAQAQARGILSEE